MLKKITASLVRLIPYQAVVAGLIFASLSFTVLAPAPAVAHHCLGHDELSISECIDAGACGGTEEAACVPTQNADQKINAVIKLILNMLSLVVGVISVIMIIIGGLKYITSSGDSANVSGAKNTILYAVVGLVVVALAQFIVRFVLAKVAGAGTPAPPATN